MKKTKDNIEHRVQLKIDEIKRYKESIKNYPQDRMEKYGLSYLNKLENELNKIKCEL